VALMVGALGVLWSARHPQESLPCREGFVRLGPRCCLQGATLGTEGECRLQQKVPCPAPLVETAHGCDRAERDVVKVPDTSAVIGPSDWEAEGRVAPHVVKVAAFWMDRLEVTMGRACEYGMKGLSRPCTEHDASRAANGVAFESARAFCASKGGRLPTEDEWIAAAAGDKPRRYPWGDTGAVCRRAAWGLLGGPCASGALGPDTVGVHPDGATPLGVHDLAGNVAEWVEARCAEGNPAGQCPRIVRGGSYETRLATELRTWMRREVREDATRGGDPTIGFRCAYDDRR
jgi:formylglycine-generating enzyme required for sulfatase activity